MHTVWSRANTVLTFFATTVSVLCVLVTLTDVLHTSDPPVSLKLTEVKRLAQHRGKQDQVSPPHGAHARTRAPPRRAAAAGSAAPTRARAARRAQAAISMALRADLSSAFSWNTKQLFVFVQAEYATPTNALNQARGPRGRHARVAACRAAAAPRAALARRPRHARRRTSCAASPQVVLWDRIVESPADAVLSLPSLRQKYAWLDHGAGLRGAEVNLTVAWNVMPRVGRLFTVSRSFPVGRLPEEYTA
ncbi:signal peptidase complex subunit 3A [Scenedesmus sp. PABB004]|nr:signal peptidase complex subunit 3A [Scenedesmus sp. PABB004]